MCAWVGWKNLLYRVGKVNPLWQTVPVKVVDPRNCSIAASLAVVGEKWSLLVIRELAVGNRRFDGIASKTGAPRDILASRLRRLEAEGLVEKRPYQAKPERHEYWLTQAGNELRPILLSLAEWGDRWTDEHTRMRYVHECGHELVMRHTCAACGGEVTGLDLTVQLRDAAVESAA